MNDDKEKLSCPNCGVHLFTAGDSTVVSPLVVKDSTSDMMIIHCQICKKDYKLTQALPTESRL